MKTAILNCSASFNSLLSTFPRSCCLSASYPLPLKSDLKTAMIESIMRREWGLSIISPAE